MSDNKKTEVDAETILLTLDQISQTIDIMTNVVGRLRGYVTEQKGGEKTNRFANSEEKQPAYKESHTLH